MHHVETKANCMRVRVIGLGKAFRMDLDEVFVSADDMYHMRHRIYRPCQLSVLSSDCAPKVAHTMSLNDTGAFSASAISWAFALTLALLVRIVLNASLKLFCLPCLDTISLSCLLAHNDSPSFRSCDPSRGEIPWSNGNSFGLGRLAEVRPSRSPSDVDG